MRGVILPKTIWGPQRYKWHLWHCSLIISELLMNGWTYFRDANHLFIRALRLISCVAGWKVFWLWNHYGAAQKVLGWQLLKWTKTKFHLTIHHQGEIESTWLIKHNLVMILPASVYSSDCGHSCCAFIRKISNFK